MTNVKFDDSGFKLVKGALKQKYYTKVGILGDKASQNHNRTPMTNAEVGAIHELGLIANIPQRSFLKMPLEEKLTSWIKENKDNYYKMLSKGNVKKWFVALGFGAEKIISDAFSTSGFGKWKQNSPYTIKLKGSSMPLIDTGQLRNSITSKLEEK